MCELVAVIKSLARIRLVSFLVFNSILDVRKSDPPKVENRATSGSMPCDLYVLILKYVTIYGYSLLGRSNKGSHVQWTEIQTPVILG